MITLVDITSSKRAKLLEFFLDNPTTTMHLRGLERKLNISATWIAKAAKEYQKNGLLTIQKSKDRKEIRIGAHRESPTYQWLKRAYNLNRLKDLVDHLDDLYGHPACIVAFGSYSKGEDTEESDIDIAVITPKKLRLDLTFFERQLSRKIRIKELVKERLMPEFLNTLANGVILKGYLTVTP